MTTHQPCGKSWTGQRAEHCPVCCETFTSPRAGDMHRVGDHNDGTRRCLSPPEMQKLGMTLNSRDMWASPSPPDRPNPWRVSTQERRTGPSGSRVAG